MRKICLGILVVLAFSFLSSCSTMHVFKKNHRSTERWVNRLYRRNGNAFYMTSTYSTGSYVWTYKGDKIEIRKLNFGKVVEKQILETKGIGPYDEKSLKEAKKELEENCFYELDGDGVGYIIRVNGDAYRDDYPSEIDCMKQNVYGSAILNDISYVINLIYGGKKNH